jgi:hypothetical protein
MNMELRAISVEEMEAVPFSPQDRMVMVEWAAHCDQLLLGTFAGEPLCIVGLMPAPGAEYLWLYTLPAAEAHKTAGMRFAKRWMARVLRQYPTIVGHCVDPTSHRWVKSLGATFNGTAFRIGT